MIKKLLHAIVAIPSVYNAVQRLAGLETMRREVTPFLEKTSGASVLDLGGGTGILKTMLPADATYYWLDNDAQKLEGYRAQFPAGLAVLGSGADLCFADASVDYALCTGVAHHLSDAELSQALGEAARVVRRGLIFLDGLKSEGRLISNLMWKYDRGEHPRTEPQLRAAVERHFDVAEKANYSIYHRYVIFLAVPKRP